MKRAHRLDEIASVLAPIQLVPGSFDGVHRGHQQLIDYANRKSREREGETWVLTFSPHPSRVLRPESPTPQMMTLDQKTSTLEELGVNGCLVLPFTEDLRTMEPERFVENLLEQASSLREIVVGSNYRFGRQARGTPELLRRYAADHGFEVTVQQPLSSGGEPVSSSRIRGCIAEGRMAEAAELLGRPFALTGPVVEGRKVGRGWGFPTANLAYRNELPPPPGIYAARAELNGRQVIGAGYRGEQPGRRTDVFEVHFLDFEGDLYGRELSVAITEKIRDDRAFSDEQSLKEQIARDIRKIREQNAAENNKHNPAISTETL